MLCGEQSCEWRLYCTTNPFNFEHCNIRHIALYLDGLAVGGNPLKLDFNADDGTATTRAFINVLMSSDKWRFDEGNALDREQFISGSTLFAFQIEPTLSHHGEYINVLKNRNVRPNIQFAKALTGNY